LRALLGLCVVPLTAPMSARQSMKSPPLSMDSTHRPLSRRRFLAGSAAIAGGVLLPASVRAADPLAPLAKAAAVTARSGDA